MIRSHTWFPFHQSCIFKKVLRVVRWSSSRTDCPDGLERLFMFYFSFLNVVCRPLRYAGVTGGAWIRNIQSHNLTLCQLSYGHMAERVGLEPTHPEGSSTLAVCPLHQLEYLSKYKTELNESWGSPTELHPLRDDRIRTCDNQLENHN